MRVIIQDDSTLVNSAVMDPKFNVPVFQRDNMGRKIQRRIVVKRVYEGRHLEIVLRRARRFLRKMAAGRHTSRAVPRHIAEGLAVLHKVDPDSFSLGAAA